MYNILSDLVEAHGYGFLNVVIIECFTYVAECTQGVIIRFDHKGLCQVQNYSV